MATHGPSIPIPVTPNGVVRGVHRSEVGPGGLVDGYNWIFRNGRMRTRDGLVVYGDDTDPRPDTNNLLTYMQSTFDGGATGWTPSGGSSISAVTSRRSPISRQSATVQLPGAGYIVSAYRTVAAGARVVASAYISEDTSLSPNMSPDLYIEERSGAGALIATHGPVAMTMDPDKWARYELTATFTPAGVRAIIKIACPAVLSGSKFWLANAMLEEGPSSASEWVPGSTTALPALYARNVNERPLGFYGYDYFSPNLIVRGRVMLGTNKGWWVHDRDSAAWRQLEGQGSAYIEPARPADTNKSSGTVVSGGTYTNVTDTDLYEIMIGPFGSLLGTDPAFIFYWRLNNATGGPIGPGAVSGVTFPIHTDGVEVTFDAGLYYGEEIWTFRAHPQTPFELTGGVSNQVVFRAYDYGGVSWIIGVNGKDQMCAWDGTDAPFGPVTGNPNISPSAAKCIMVVGGRVVACNFSFGPSIDNYYPNGVVYSGTVLSGGFSAWDSANIIRLNDTPGEIIACMEMGNLSGVIYKTDGIYVLVQQTGTEPYRLMLKASGIPGPASPLSVTKINENTHAYLSRTGEVMLFDGSTPVSMGLHIREYIQATCDKEHMDQSWVAHDMEHNELLVMYPGSHFTADRNDGCLRIGIIISLERQGYPMWPINWPAASGFNMTAGTFALTSEDARIEDLILPFNTYNVRLDSFISSEYGILLGDVSGQIYKMGGGNDNGQPIVASFTTGQTDGGEQDRVKTIKEVDHKLSVVPLDGVSGPPADPDADITVELMLENYADHAAPSDPITFTAEPTVYVGTPDENGPFITQHRDQARSIGLRLTSSSSSIVFWGGSYAAVRARGKR